MVLQILIFFPYLSTTADENEGQQGHPVKSLTGHSLASWLNSTPSTHKRGSDSSWWVALLFQDPQEHRLIRILEELLPGHIIPTRCIQMVQELKSNVCCGVLPRPPLLRTETLIPQAVRNAGNWRLSTESLSGHCPGKASQRKPLSLGSHAIPGVSSHPGAHQGESIKLGSLHARKDTSAGPSQL